MSSINTETETVIKKILPYMKRRGYDIEKDFDFETAVNTTDRYTKGYVDILVTLGKRNPLFLIEAKRIGKNLTNKDRDQAISYARSKEIKVPFVIIQKIRIEFYGMEKDLIRFQVGLKLKKLLKI